MRKEKILKKNNRMQMNQKVSLKKMNSDESWSFSSFSSFISPNLIFSFDFLSCFLFLRLFFLCFYLSIFVGHFISNQIGLILV